jgi:hypothetical protein
MKYYDIYITCVIIVKAIFIVLSLTYIYLKIKNKQNTTLASKVNYWKERVEFLFVLLMALLLIYLFNPRANRSNINDTETKILFFLFGFVLLITAKWENFFKESKWIVYLQKSLGQQVKVN